MAALAGSLNGSSLPNVLKNEARRYLNGGLDSWDVSPLGQFNGETSCPNCHIVSCSYGTLVAFIQLIRDISASFVSQGASTGATLYLLALADDLSSPPIGGNSSGKEPYP